MIRLSGSVKLNRSFPFGVPLFFRDRSEGLSAAACRCLSAYRASITRLASSSFALRSRRRAISSGALSPSSKGFASTASAFAVNAATSFYNSAIIRVAWS
jgi:hypothetical protein